MRKQSIGKMADSTYLYAYVIFFLAVCYLGYLATFIHTGVFYSADGGVKYLVIKQLTEGQGFKYMHLSQPAWVQSLWQNGYFPFRPPWVYPSAKGYIYVFPPAFQFINSFIYARLGNSGLYILPFSSTLLLWIWTIYILKRCQIEPSRIALALFILVFCTPLTVYGSMYWEHVPAILLLFAGAAFIVDTPSRTGIAILLGLLSGAAVWLRPEAIMMNMLYAGAVCTIFYTDRRPVYIAFLSGLLFCTVAFLLFNKAEYGSFLGVHAVQMLDDESETKIGIGTGLYNLWENNYLSIRNFFFVCLLIPIFYHLAISQQRRNLHITLLAAVVFGFCLLTPFMVPNDGGRQWGARYFLPIIPVTLIVLFVADKQWDFRWRLRRIPLWLLCFLGLCFGYSFYHNTVTGGLKNLRWAYFGRVKPAMDYIENTTSPVVVVSTPYMMYELSYLFDKKFFFLAHGDDSLRKLLPMLKQQGIHQYTYIFDPRNPGDQPKMLRDSITAKFALNNKNDQEIKDEFYCSSYTIQ